MNGCHFSIPNIIVYYFINGTSCFYYLLTRAILINVVIEVFYKGLKVHCKTFRIFAIVLRTHIQKKGLERVYKTGSETAGARGSRDSRVIVHAFRAWRLASSDHLQNKTDCIAV